MARIERVSYRRGFIESLEEVGINEGDDILGEVGCLGM